MKHPVKKILLLVVLILNGCMLMAQKHFMYVESEGKQPFAIVMNGKVFSSSDYGYIIIPKLKDSTYNFTVSFPLNKFPDQPFSCTINKKDEGFTLKKENNSWALVNIQTQKSIDNTASNSSNKNAFGDMLSDVVSDSTLMQKPVVPPAVTAAATTTTTVIPPPQKIAEAKLDTGTNMLFVDKNLNGADTINVFIPVETVNANTAIAPQKPSTANIDTIVNNNVQPEASTINNTTMPADTSAHNVSNPFFKPDQNNNTAATSVASSAPQASSSNVTGATRQTCDNLISNDDLNKLKRKMFSHSDDQSMIQSAIKNLGKKCISTEQVKSLGQLFSSDDGRYNLYDALYMHTSDYINYPNLSTQIIDPYYKKRFMALLR